jgi:hypothetical protein
MQRPVFSFRTRRRMAMPESQRKQAPLHPGAPPTCQPTVFPREPGRTRLPVHIKLYCEALTGVADPVTT